MSTLLDFLLTRIAEDEAQAREATQGTWVPYSQGWEVEGGAAFITAPYHDLDIWPDDVQHITRWQPGRVLAECEAKRRIVGAWQALDADSAVSPEAFQVADEMLAPLALPYANHPDYRQEWAA